MAVPALSAYGPWIQGFSFFQQNAVANKAVLDIVGVEAPTIGLTRNRVERKEKLFQRSLACFAAFIIAPLHAWLVAKGVSNGFKLPEEALNISFSQLSSTQKLAEILKKLDTRSTQALQTLKKTPSGQLETLRTKTLNAKVAMLVIDLMIESLIFANMGWIRNFFSERMTGKKQFTGEMGITSQQKLDQLYQKQAKTQRFSEKALKAITTSLAIAIPLLLGGTLRHSLIKPSPNQLWQKVKAISHYFDYTERIYLSNLAFYVVSTMSNIGDTLSARSPREMKEVMLRKFPLDLLFFFGGPAWIWLFSKVFPNPHKLPETLSIKSAVSQAKTGVKKLAAKRAAGFFALSFVLNAALLSGILIWTNRKTTQKLKADLQKLEAQQPRQLGQLTA